MKTRTTEEAARLVRICRATLQAWIAAEKIKPPKLQIVAGKAVRLWGAADIEKLRTAKRAIYGKGRSGRPRRKGGRHGN